MIKSHCTGQLCRLIVLLILVAAVPVHAQQKDSLTVSYTPFPPFLFDDENKEPRGIIRDLWELWSGQTKIPVVFQKAGTSRKGQTSAGSVGNVLALLGPQTEDSGLSVFSLPLPDLEFFLYVRSNAFALPDGLRALSGKQVGVVAGGPAGAVIKNRSPDVAVVPFPSHESLIRAAMSGKIMAFVMEKPVASTYLAKFKGYEMVRAMDRVLFHHPLQAAILSGKKDLSDRIREGFAALPPDDIRKIISSWTGETRAVTLPAHTRTLRIAASIDNMPFHFADSQGRAVGMFVDLWKLWAEKTGVEVEFIPVPWASSLDMVKNGAADIHAGCFFSVHRDTYLDYANKLRDCQTHFFFHESIYGLKGLQDLKGFEIGVLDKDYAVEFVRRELPGAALKIYGSHQQMFKGVADGEIKVFVCDTPTALYFMTREDLIAEFRYHPSRPLYRKPFFAAVREGNKDLVDLINQGLDAITPEERAVIERRWMGKVPEQTRNQVIIGMDQSFPPFSMRSASGEPSGLLVAFWKAWARKNNREAVIHLYERQEAVNALKDGIIDILSTFPPRKTTHGWAGFCAPHYRLDWHLYLTRNRTVNDTFVFDPDTDFTRMTVGALNHSRAQEWLDNKIEGPRTVGFDTTEQMILAAAREKIDGFLATPQEMAVLPGQMGLPGSFSKSRAPIFQMTAKAGVRNYNPGLVAAIEEGFNRLSQREKSAIEARWVTEPALRVYARGNTEIQLTGEEEKWLTTLKLEGNPIRLKVDPAWPPFEFIGKNQSYLGMVSDIVGMLKERLGLPLELITDLSATGADVVPAAMSFKAPSSAMAYTQPYLSFPWVIITRAQAPLITGLMDMTDKVLACDSSFFTYDRLEQDWPGIRLMAVASTKEGLEAVRSGKADGYLGNLALSGYQIQANNYADLKVAAATSLDNGGLVFAVRKDWPELVRILDKGIASFTAGELDQVRQKWFTVKFDQGAHLAFVTKVARRISYAVLAVFVLVLFWNRMIHRREERFRCLTEHGTDIIQAFSPEGNLVYASPSHASVLGYPMKQVRGASVFSMIHPEDVPGFKKMVDQLYRKGGTDTHIYRIRHYNGRYLSFESHCMNLLQNKAIRAFVINGRDITDALKARHEIEAAKESAEAANQSKTEFLASLGHEVRTPLNAILGMTEMTLSTRLTGHQNKNLGAVLAAARHLKAVISDILDFTTIEAGRMRIRKQVFRLDRFLENLSYTWEVEAGKKGLKLFFDAQEGVPDQVEADPVRLGQILTNLLSNAVKFTPEGEIRIHVGVAPSGTGMGVDDAMMLFFRVSDTGIGISPDHREKIFQRFTQAQGSITREYGGTGLGLAICHEMAELMGGSIGLDSTVGEGSCFTLTLPFVPVAMDAIEPDNAEEAADVIDPELVLLLVEDDPVNQAVFREMLYGAGCRVIHAGDGEKALDCLTENRIDIVFMDLEMPKMDGLTATRHIREGRAGQRNKDIPVVAMTAHVLDEFRAKARAAGMDQFLAKPVERRDLFDILKAAVRRMEPSAADNDAPLMDRDQALTALGGNEDLLDTVLGIFVRETPALTEMLSTALADMNYEDIGLSAHTLKGAGARIYASRAVDAAAHLEKLAKASKPDPDAVALAGQKTLHIFAKLIDSLDKGQEKGNS